MEKLFSIKVEITASQYINGHSSDICMISFTGAVESELFTGRTIGDGVDTQKISKDKSAFLSARYMLEGVDYKGQKCRIFIENNGSFENGFFPTIVTDSKALAGLEGAKLSAAITNWEKGVIIDIFYYIGNSAI